MIGGWISAPATDDATDPSGDRPAGAPLEPRPRRRLPRPVPTPDVAAETGRRVIWFDSPDGAYLVAAAARRYLDAMVVPDVILIPTDRGPALQVPAGVASMRVMRALVERFGGHVDPTVMEDWQDSTFVDAASGSRPE